jgi:response regulator NasT
VSPSEAETSPRRRIVVAEDEALIRLDLVEMLSEAGFDVVGQAGNGADAIDLAERLRPHAVLLDVKMPILDGLSAAERISGDRIAPVVILTAFSQRSLVERAMESGAMAYLVKPFTAADLLPAIEVAIARYEQMNQLVDEVDRLEDALETRKLVERAKALLSSKYSLSEPDAFRWIQRAAMDRRMSMRQVAEVVIEQAAPSGSSDA